MISRFHVQNYKALRDVTLHLTPMHLLIGPNDSGKSSLLEALAALCRSVDMNLSAAFAGRWQGSELVWNQAEEEHVSLSAEICRGDGLLTYRLSVYFALRGVEPGVRDVIISSESSFGPVQLGSRKLNTTNLRRILADRDTFAEDEDKREFCEFIHSQLSGVHTYQFMPRLLALPVAQSATQRFRMDPTGFGLALCLDDILGYDRGLFDRLETRFKQIFQDVQSIKLLREPAYAASPNAQEDVPILGKAEGKGIHFQFKNSGQLVPAAQASDGMLLVLAYLAILHLPNPPRVLLIEEPETGIHPKRLQDVMEILRELIEEQSHTQVLLTTHSPYVVDLFSPEEVTLCRKLDNGEVAVKWLKDSEAVKSQLDVFTLGEIWTGEGEDVLARDESGD